MAAAYEVEYSPLIHKLLQMIPLIRKARNSFPKEHAQYKRFDEMLDQLIDKLGKVIFSPEKQHLPLLFENVVHKEQHDLPDVYTPTESDTNFDAYSYLKTIIPGPMNESLERTETEREKKEEREKREREAKKQKEVDELMERWNA